MTTGIYSIKNIKNGNQYIGSSANIEERWKRHISRLNKCEHHSRHLQNAWQYYGAESFDFSILLICDVDSLIEYEQYCIDTMKPVYNVSPTAGRTAGIIRTNEYKLKQSKSQSGKVMSEETRRKISEGMKGKRNSLGTKRAQTNETIEKIKNALTGHLVSSETRAKIGLKNKGYKHTEEAKQKISNSLLGNTRAGAKRNE